ncbi:uncharacterized protein LOC125473203 isoform X2 [Pyrus x bretschneideri]|uniref:uncharacterized protein LOC125473203 isoform X2 n=1 Tax=Pyrus x bretschneideri TaxID=225117 RepID=UPI00202F17C5|nr:uncharacterized protein LOC125473203 isoform X2 [Pyrus x bretschneideri]
MFCHLKFAENSGSRSFENPQDIGRWLLQALKENATARSAIPDLEEKKNSSHGKRKTVCKPFTKPIYFLDPWNNRNLAPGIVDPAMNIRNPMRKFKHLASLDAVKLREMRPDYIPVIMEKDARSDVPDVDMRRRLAEKRRKRAYVDIMRNAFVYLEPWNLRSYKMALSSTPSMSENTRKFYLERYKQLYGNLSEEQRTCTDARQLREKRADYIPVSVEKDPRADSDVPDIDVKKYHVPRQKTLGEFVDLIQMDIAVSKTFHVRVFCKNTELPAGASMSAIDDEFKDGDGFLRLTYIGEERACQSAS